MHNAKCHGHLSMDILQLCVWSVCAFRRMMCALSIRETLKYHTRCSAFFSKGRKGETEGTREKARERYRGREGESESSGLC